MCCIHVLLKVLLGVWKEIKSVNSHYCSTEFHTCHTPHPTPPLWPARQTGYHHTYYTPLTSPITPACQTGYHHTCTTPPPPPLHPPACPSNRVLSYMYPHPASHTPPARQVQLGPRYEGQLNPMAEPIPHEVRPLVRTHVYHPYHAADR